MQSQIRPTEPCAESGFPISHKSLQKDAEVILYLLWQAQHSRLHMHEQATRQPDAAHTLHG
jgi:hypothetical protein